jgi:hypothetical protein
MTKIFLTIFFCCKIIISVFPQTGLYFEYKVSQKDNNQTTGTFTVNSLDGNSISELKYMSPYANTTLHLKSNPDLGYHLNQDKTYSQMEDKQLNEYAIKVFGKETLNGLQCVKIAVYTHSGDGYSILWISNEIPHYKKYLTADINNCNLTKLNSALKKQNLGGIPVRIIGTEGTGLQFDLVKATFVDLDKSMFSLDKYQELKMQPMTNDHLQQMFSIPTTSANIIVGVFSKEKNEPIPYSSIKVYRNGKQEEAYQTDNRGTSNFGLNYTNETITIEAGTLGFITRDTILSVKSGIYKIKLYLDKDNEKIDSEK